MKYPLVRVIWKDATEIGGTTLSQQQKKQLPIFENVGYLIHKDKKRIVIAHQVQIFDDGIGGTEKDGNQGDAIPLSWIIKLEKIKVCKKKYN